MSKRPADDKATAWDLTKNKRVTITEFKGQKYVDIREYYTDKETSELKPGKKGISLSMDQFDKFLSVLPEVEQAVKDTKRAKKDNSTTATPASDA